MAQRPLDLRKIERIYELFEGWATISEIVKEVGTNRESVRKYLLKRYSKAQKRAIVLRNFKQPKGRASSNGRGGRQITKTGYVRIWLSRHESVLEHRQVMERHLGRKLSRSEVVHHINGNN